MAQQSNSGLDLLMFEISGSHTIRQPTDGLLWASDQLVAEAGTYTTQNKDKRRMPKLSEYIRTRDPRN